MPGAILGIRKNALEKIKKVLDKVMVYVYNKPRR